MMNYRVEEAMAKKLFLALIALGYMVTVLPLLARSTADGPQKVADWFDALPKARQQKTHIHFYFHDILSGKNPTAIRIVEPPPDSEKYRTLFGFINMMDDPLTAGPDPGSEPVGRAQGFYGSAGLDTFGLLMNMNLIFTGKEFNGSTLSILGRNPAVETYREMPILGGTGVFRLARGIATAKTVFFNASNGDAIVEYNVVVLHYSLDDE